MSTIKDKFIRIVGLFGILSVPFIIFAIIHPEGFDPVKYWLFYKPVYELFSGSLYFPFYLKSIKTFLIFLLFSIFIIYIYRDKWKEFSRLKTILTYTTIAVILFTISFLFLRSTLTDMHYVVKNTYYVEDVNLLSLERRRSGGKGPIYYYIGRRELNVYQYRELKAIRDNYEFTLENLDRVIKRKGTYLYPPSFSRADKIYILSVLNSSDELKKRQMFKKLGIEINIKVKIRYLPSSRQVLTYELRE